MVDRERQDIPKPDPTEDYLDELAAVPIPSGLDESFSSPRAPELDVPGMEVQKGPLGEIELPGMMSEEDQKALARKIFGLDPVQEAKPPPEEEPPDERTSDTEDEESEAPEPPPEQEKQSQDETRIEVLRVKQNEVIEFLRRQQAVLRPELGTDLDEVVHRLNMLDEAVLPLRNIWGGEGIQVSNGPDGVGISRADDPEFPLMLPPHGTHLSPQDIAPSSVNFEQETAEADSWDKTTQTTGNDGLKVRLQTRTAYDDTSDEILYAFWRELQFNSIGELVTIGAEARVTVDEPVDCPTDIDGGTY